MEPVVGRWYQRAWACLALEVSAENSQRSGMVCRWWCCSKEVEEEEDEEVTEDGNDGELSAAFTFLTQPSTGAAYPSPR